MTEFKQSPELLALMDKALLEFIEAGFSEEEVLFMIKRDVCFVPHQVQDKLHDEILCRFKELKQAHN